MTAIAILLGFALMIMLPCLVTLLRMRDSNVAEHPEANAYADRVIETRGYAKSEETSVWRGHDGWEVDPEQAGVSAGDGMGAWWPVSASRRTGELQQDSSRRFEEAEREALRSRLSAARAHADALAAVARIAEIKAKEAAHQAAMLEAELTKALDGARRAA